MNTHMYENPLSMDNLEKLRRFGYKIIAPAVECLPAGCGRRKNAGAGNAAGVDLTGNRL